MDLTPEEPEDGTERNPDQNGPLAGLQERRRARARESRGRERHLALAQRRQVQILLLLFVLTTTLGKFAFNYPCTVERH